MSASGRKKSLFDPAAPRDFKFTWNDVVYEKRDAFINGFYFGLLAGVLIASGLAFVVGI